MSEPKIVTLGCRLNTLESEVMRDELKRAGQDDAIIINTCAVTREAERQARQTIRRLKRDNPNARIIVTGCAAQLDPSTYAEMDEVDRVVGNMEKLDARTLLGNGPGVSVSDIMEIKETAGHLVSGLEGRTRAFIQIQQGCDHRCTFCIIPFARGPNRSVDLDAIVDQAAKLAASGHVEVVLTGVDIASYGSDQDHDLALSDVVEAILDRVSAIERIRLSSLDPAAIDDKLCDLLAREHRLMPHLHLSLQAADDMILKRMKRRHSRTSVADAIQRARKARPDLVLGADIIAGFPTEDEQMFQNTLDAVEEFGLTYLHVFPFSARPGTPAAKMPQHKGNEPKDRAARLREVGEWAKTTYFNAWIGREVRVLVEKEGFGHSDHFAPVRVNKDIEPGTVLTVRIARVEDGNLIAEDA